LDKIDSTSRLSSISTQVVLTQTDTTVGFLSQNEKQLKNIKSRESSKPFIKVFKSFYALKKSNIRVPHNRKKMLRRAKKTTFIIKNSAFRVAQETLNSSVLRATQWNYSTSANASGKSFELKFCEEKADIIIQDKNTLFEGKASSLLKINKKRIKRLR